ncbi:Nmad5 family putative nucleotide modification protein [Sansalvadorimonas verongulae]|uniref:Nmad5 family putative nucleotide modification protein n=1 Tax=Sansalvadorimonas verongulae TaxID=2172824 RepID=UPI0012BB752E|nr:Nmad5 family putative nucleotide modification protein [Sansalvadorimonas verongulae]MTI13814.1 hypothetical protein [Sansalvadorimonas verongulae]
MRLSKQAKQIMLVNALETIFGKEMDKLNEQLVKMTQKLIPLYEKDIGPWQAINPAFLVTTSRVRLAFPDKVGDHQWRNMVFLNKESRERKLRENNLDIRTALLSLHTTVVAKPYENYPCLKLGILLAKSPAKLRKLEEHSNKTRELVKRLENTRSELQRLMMSCNTVKALKEAWPEGIEKGILELPEESKTPNLPVAVHNLNEMVFGHDGQRRA